MRFERMVWFVVIGLLPFGLGSLRLQGRRSGLQLDGLALARHKLTDMGGGQFNRRRVR